MRPDLTRIVDSFQNDIVHFAQKLLQVQSLPGNEGVVANLVHAEVERLGYDQVWRDEIGNVIGLMRGAGDSKSLMLNSHLDQVDVGNERQWPYPPLNAVIANDFIWGRGACDNKGPLAVQVYAPAMARKAGLNIARDVYVTAVVLEESGGWGTAHLLQKIKADYAIVGQPSNNELRIGHRGRTELHIHLVGQSAHASRPERAANPHYMLARVVNKLRELPMSSDPIFGYSMVAPTLITTDQRSANVTPGELRLTLDWRNIPSETPSQILAKVQRLVDSCAELGIRARVEVPKRRFTSYTRVTEVHEVIHPGYYIPESHPLTSAVRSILQRALEREIETGIWGFATDGGHLMAAGIPTIGFAPGDEHFAHTTQERIAIAQMREAAVGYLALIENLR